MILFVWKRNFPFVVFDLLISFFYSVDECIQQFAEMKKKK